MDTMQQELRDSYPLLQIQLVGINERGQEPGNATATAGLSLPWLQDVDANSDGKSDVFESWQVALRDVVILDGDNAKVGVYNLNTHDLAIPANYATLQQMLVDAAMASQLPWRNASRPLDVDNNGVIAPLDVLIVINRLNSQGSGALPPPVANQSPPPFYDTSGDNQLTALDALKVINYLNAAWAVAAGEGESFAPTIQRADASRAWLPIEATGTAPSLDLAASASPALLPEQTPGLTSNRSWQIGVDLAFAADAASDSHSLPRSASASEPSEPWPFDPWWLPGRNILSA